MGDLGRKTGFVKFFENSRGYGFIECDDNDPDIFVHVDHTIGEGYRRLISGQRVSFFVVQSERGPQARQVMLLGEEGELIRVPPASALVPQSRPMPQACERITTSVGNRMSEAEQAAHRAAVDVQREKYLKDLRERAPNWVAAAREEQQAERVEPAAEAPEIKLAERPAVGLPGIPARLPRGPAEAAAEAEQPAPAADDDEHLRQGQRTYILAALEQIQKLARHADKKQGSLVQLRRLAANIELIIEAPDSPEALGFGEADATDFDW